MLTSTESPQLSSSFGQAGDDSPNLNSRTAKKGIRVEEAPRDRSSFYADLLKFHSIKGTAIPRYPKINGVDIDLHRLYNLVIGRGGWAKVNYRSEWDEMLPDFGISKNCVNASVALKNIYIRFLDRYEKVHFLGEDTERVDDLDEDSRHKKWSSKNFCSVPLSYNYAQHNIHESMRAHNKMSTDLYRASPYERLLMSLMSPLPNEQDFAINACALMANESKHTLKIELCPKLVDTLLGHAGVFSHFTMRDIFNEFYTTIRRNSLQSFWADSLYDKPQILELSYDDYFQSPDENFGDSSPGRPPIRLRESDREHFDDGLTAKHDELQDMQSMSYLNLGRGLGTHEYIGQRVYQIASILRNLSFIDDNLTTLVRNKTFIRFLVMCSNLRWGNLHHMGLDMLGNISSDLILADPSSDDLTRNLLSTVCEGLESPDRGVIISCLEILYKLSQNEANEEHLHRCLDKKLYTQICLFLMLNDIMLLLYTLECIYALTSLGERACSNIVQVSGIVDTLVALVTVEAQSYGPDGCILMRVVETVPQNMMQILGNTMPVQHPIQNLIENPSQHQYTALVNSEPPKQPQQFVAVPHQLPQSTVIRQASVQVPQQVIHQIVNTAQQPAQPMQPPQQQPPLQQQVVVQPALQQIQTQVIVNKQWPQQQTSQQQQPPQQQTSQPAQPPGTAAVADPTTKDAKHAQQQIIQESEQFAIAWLRSACEPVTSLSSKIEQNDLYKMYLTASARYGRKDIVTQVHFPRCVRSVFGGSVGPNQIKVKIGPNTDNMTTFYEGIKVRPKPQQLVFKGVALKPSKIEVVFKKVDQPQTNAKTQMQVTQGTPTKTQQSGSILVAQLAGKTAGLNQTSSDGQLVIKQTVQPQAQGAHQQVVIQPSSHIVGNTTITPTSGNTTSSSLIKSLLANKVNSVESSKAASQTCLITPNVSVHQVAQRQHLQKQKEMAQQLAMTNANTSQTITMKTTPVKTVIPAIISKKESDTTDNVSSNWDTVPPLAPLSGTHATIRQTVHAQTDVDTKPALEEGEIRIVDGSVMVGSQKGIIYDDDLKPSHVVTSNKMLADLLERKSSEPPIGNISDNSTASKRKLDDPSSSGDVGQMKKEKIEPAGTAADLYAKLAASMLEDDDMEVDEDSKAAVVAATTVKTEATAPTEPQKQVITVQRQIIMSANNQPQMIISNQPNQQTAQATATIKTESGYQTVPVIFQHSGNINQNIQIQKQPNQTQYVLATNQQGQTYLVAQPHQPQQQTVLVTQTPQQQGTQSKTIIILQQQQPGGAAGQAGQQTGQIISAGGTQQKVIMATQQGQQMIVTQVPRPVPHQIIMNHPVSTQGTILQAQPSITNTTAAIVAPHQITKQIQLPPQTQITQHIQYGNQNQQTPVIQQTPSPQIHIQQHTAKPIIQSAAPTAVSQPTTTAAIHPQIQIQTIPPPTAASQQNTVQQRASPQPQIQIQLQQRVLVQPPIASPQPTASQPPAQPATPPSEDKKPKVEPTADDSPAASPKPAAAPQEEQIDASYLYVCDWRGCPRKKFRSINDVSMHVCHAHCPDNLDAGAEIFCQWGGALCDNVPRKRFSLMTHLLDRHCNAEGLRLAVQRRSKAGVQPNPPSQPVTIIKTPTPQPEAAAGSASPALSNSSSGTAPSASAAMHAIKRHALDFVNPKELMDENEGPVTKSIRLTAALILRNLVNYTSTAKRALRYHEPHLAGVALSNVESSRTIAQVLFEMNE